MQEKRRNHTEIRLNSAEAHKVFTHFNVYNRIFVNNFLNTLSAEHNLHFNHGSKKYSNLLRFVEGGGGNKHLITILTPEIEISHPKTLG
ncbi:hypothetical protein NQ318_007649 [Aromia moschata]|uniref:Uncharacterized protein n=1 Tax=Aromia moschata TaxID=1265417 RepID=A0AAV8XPC9_9CUCU|nr:hypothetical protein NQ318_007649 [Aromia moschata]